MKTGMTTCCLLLTMLTLCTCTHTPQLTATPEPQPQPQPQVTQPEPATVPQQPSEEELKTQTEQPIKQLGSKDYKERERAHAELVRLVGTRSGIVLGTLLRVHNTTRDPEVKMRLERILPQYQLYLKWKITPATLEAVPDIVQLLEEDSHGSIRIAVEGLRPLKPADKRDTLFAILRNCKSGKLLTTDALVDIGDKEVVRFFIEAYRPEDEPEEQQGGGIIDLDDDETQNPHRFAGYALRKLGDKALPYQTEMFYKLDRFEIWQPLACLIAGLGEKGEEVLLKALEKGTPAAKASALWCILRLTNATPPLEVLLKLLKDKNTELRRYAALALVLHEDEKAANALVETLKDSPTVRYAAAHALALKRDKRAIPVLKEAAKDQNRDVRFDAAIGLGYFRDARVVEPLMELKRDSDHHNTGIAAGFSLRRVGQAALPELHRRYKESDGQAREDALYAIIDLTRDKAALKPLLVKALKDKDDGIRLAAIRGLVQHKSKELSDVFLDVLKDSDEYVRSYAAGALAELGDERAVGALITMLEDNQTKDKGQIALTLARLGGRKALQAIVRAYDRKDIGLSPYTVRAIRETTDRDIFSLLVEALKDPNLHVRRDAVSSLVALGDERALKPLAEILHRKKDSENTGYALVKIGGLKALPYLIDALKTPWRKGIIYTIVMFGEDAINHLLCAVDSTDARIKYAALEALALLRDEEARKLLIKKLKGTESERQWAAELLVKYKDPHALELLLKKLRDGDTYDHQKVIPLILQLGDRRAVKPLIKILLDGTEDKDRAEAALALGGLGDSTAIEPLTAMLLDDNDGVRKAAAEALGAFKDSGATDALMKAVTDGSSAVRSKAARSLGRIGDRKAIAALMQAPVSGATAAALRKFRAGETVDYFLSIVTNLPLMNGLREDIIYTTYYPRDSYEDVLLDKYDNEDVGCRISAIFALGEIRDRQATEPLKRLLRVERQCVRMGAAVALLHLGDKDAQEILKKALTSQDEDSGHYALRALVESPDPKALPLLLGALESEVVGFLGESDVVEALVEIGGKQVCDALFAKFKEKGWHLILKSLADLGDKRAIGPLIEILASDPYHYNRKSALRTLIEFTGQNFGWNYQRWRRWFKENKDE